MNGYRLLSRLQMRACLQQPRGPLRRFYTPYEVRWPHALHAPRTAQVKASSSVPARRKGGFNAIQLLPQRPPAPARGLPTFLSTLPSRARRCAAPRTHPRAGGHAQLAGRLLGVVPGRSVRYHQPHTGDQQQASRQGRMARGGRAEGGLVQLLGGATP